MLFLKRNSDGERTAWPWRLRGFARAALVLGWMAFWLNAASIQCCEASAAVASGHTDSVAHSASAPVASSAHPEVAGHSDALDHDSGSFCGTSAGSGAALVGEPVAASPDRAPMKWIGFGMQVVTSPAPVSFLASNFALARTSPAPSLSFFLRTQRLLI